MPEALSRILGVARLMDPNKIVTDGQSGCRNCVFLVTPRCCVLSRSESVFVKSFHFVTGSDMLTSDVTFSYGEVKVTEGSGGGSGTPVPESSSLALLGAGLLSLIGFRRKKLGPRFLG
jgi:hypothetical protein